MTIDAAKLDALSSAFPGARALPEAGIDYVLIPNLRFMAGTTERVMDALLCPVRHGGYATRLFLAAAIPEKQRNWTQHHILGRTWHTWSWQGVPENLSLLQILASHLRALR